MRVAICRILGESRERRGASGRFREREVVSLLRIEACFYHRHSHNTGSLCFSFGQFPQRVDVLKQRKVRVVSKLDSNA